MSASTPNPSYHNRRGRPNWRFKLRHPRYYLRMILLWRYRKWKRIILRQPARGYVEVITPAPEQPPAAVRQDGQAG